MEILAWICPVAVSVSTIINLLAWGLVFINEQWRHNADVIRKTYPRLHLHADWQIAGIALLLSSIPQLWPMGVAWKILRTAIPRIYKELTSRQP